MLPLMKVVPPSNAAIFFSAIFQIAAFEVYETGDAVNAGLGLPEKPGLSPNFEELGFESIYFINNMGTMIFFHAVYPLAVLVQ